MICCDWQTLVLTSTHTHAPSLLSREHRCLWRHLFCISCHAISSQWKPLPASCACNGLITTQFHHHHLFYRSASTVWLCEYKTFCRNQHEVTRKLEFSWFWFKRIKIFVLTLPNTNNHFFNHMINSVRFKNLECVWNSFSVYQIKRATHSHLIPVHCWDRSRNVRRQSGSEGKVRFMLYNKIQLDQKTLMQVLADPTASWHAY